MTQPPADADEARPDDSEDQPPTPEADEQTDGQADTDALDDHTALEADSGDASDTGEEPSDPGLEGEDAASEAAVPAGEAAGASEELTPEDEAEALALGGDKLAPPEAETPFDGDTNADFEPADEAANDEEVAALAVGALPAPPAELLGPPPPPPTVAPPEPEPAPLSPEAALRASIQARRARLGGFPVTAHALILTTLLGGVFLMFLLIEPTPRWLALFGAGVAALGTEGVLRSARREPFASGLDTTPFLFLPTLFALATPVFLEHNARGYWAVPAALAGAAAFGAVVLAEVSSVRQYDPAHALARFVTAGATYFVAFALFSLSYDFDLGMRPALAAVGLAGVLLGIELLREGEVDPQETLVMSVIVGVLLAEARWTLHFLPLDGYLAGLALVFVFFLLAGLLHAYITRALDRVIALQHAVITALGLALVVGARATGIA